MTSAVLGKAGRKLFAKHLEQYAPADPLYEYYINEKGKRKRRKREVPPGLSVRDADILRSVNRRAHYLDRGFSVGGMRFGWTAIIGIVPAAGDVTDILLNYYLIVRKAREAEIPGWLVRRMLVNNAISGLVGFVPFAGDIIIAQFKANSRNAALLEEFLRIRGEVYLEMLAEGKPVKQIGAPKPVGSKKKEKDTKGKEVSKAKDKESNKEKDKEKDKEKGKKSDDKSVSAGGDAAKKEKGDKVADADGGNEAVASEGTARSDVEQIKPGAGLQDGEVIPNESLLRVPPGDDAASSVNTSAPASEVGHINQPAPASANAKQGGKRKLSFPSWRARGKSTNRGRFVENLSSEGGDSGAADASTSGT